MATAIRAPVPVGSGGDEPTITEPYHPLTDWQHRDARRDKLAGAGRVRERGGRQKRVCAVAHPVLFRGPSSAVRPLAFLTFLFVALLPALAFGQSITIGAVDQFEHSVDTDSMTLSEIWFEECENEGATITIPITLTGIDDDNVRIFVSKSVDCANNDERDEAINAGTCINIGGLEDKNTVKLDVRQILRPLTSEGVDSANFCSSIGQDTVQVFLLDLGTSTVTTSARTTFSIDFLGPNPPELERVGIGENQLIVHWDASSSSDIDGYRIFCEPLSDGSLVGEGGADGEAASPDCSGTSLIAGQRPPGSVRASPQYGVTKDSGAYEDLENGVWYACAVAGVDAQGNYGNLSELACGRPQPVTDFYEAYVNAGGEGGGGFCAFSRAPHRSALALLAATALMLAARRRKGAARS